MNDQPNNQTSEERYPTAQRVDIVCDEFESAWQEGQRPAIEQFLKNVAGEERSQLLRELIALEIEFRSKSGETPQLDEYNKRFADIDLTDLFSKPIETISLIGPTAEEAATVDDHVDHTLSISKEVPFNSQLIQKESDHAKLTSIAPIDYNDERDVQQFGDYAIVSEIARGGMGVVYKAYQKSLNRLVALKMISRGEFANPEEISRFQIEAESAARLDHPGIVPVYEVGEREGRHYFSMGLVEGGSLSSAVTSQSLTHKEVAQLVLKIAEAVAYAHSKGVIHRDLKPGNVLVDKNNEPRITDFGLAKQIEDGSNLTVTGQIIGTPNYMPPEQAGGQTNEIVETADIYSVGAILYALMCGRPPFQSPNVMNTLVQVIKQEPVAPRQFNPKIPVDLETICLKCLQKNRLQRYQSATELANELRCFIEGRPIAARPVSTLSRFKRWCQRNPIVAGLSAAFVVSLVAGLCVSIYFAILAQGRADAAQQGATIAMNTLDKVIYKIHKDLEKIPNARTIRRDLLKQALDDLNQIPVEFLEQSKLDRDSATVMRNLGQIISELGDDEESATNRAVSYFKRSIDILEGLYADDPTSELLIDDLAKSNEMLGDLYLDLNQHQNAQPYLARNLELLEQLASEYPQKAKYKFGLSYAHMLKGDMLSMRRQFKQAIEPFEKATTLITELLAQEPANTIYRDQHAMYLEKIGDSYFDSNDLNTAQQYYEQSHVIFESLYNAEPHDTRYQFNYSTSFERLGNLFVRLKQYEKARDMYQREVAISIQTVKDDPTNISHKQDLGIAYEKLANAQTFLKDYEGALKSTRKWIELTKPIVEQDPENSIEVQSLQRAKSKLAHLKRMIQQAEQSTTQP